MCVVSESLVKTASKTNKWSTPIPSESSYDCWFGRRRALWDIVNRRSATQRAAIGGSLGSLLWPKICCLIKMIIVMVMIIIIIIVSDTKDSYWRVVGLPWTDRRRQKETFVCRRGNLPESGEWRFDKQEEMADKRFWKYILAKSLLVKIEKSLSALILDLLNYSI